MPCSNQAPKTAKYSFRINKKAKTGIPNQTTKKGTTKEMQGDLWRGDSR
jgi:hypothetical protein